MQRRARLLGLALEHRRARVGLRRDHGRHAALEDAGLLGGDLLERVAEKFDVIDRDRRDDAGERTLDHIGGVEPAAEADFEQQHVGGMAREQHEGGRGLDLEHRDRRVAVGALAFGERVGELGVGDQQAAAREPSRKRSLKRTRCGEV